jgi:hypothetical protein
VDRMTLVSYARIALWLVTTVSELMCC